MAFTPAPALDCGQGADRGIADAALGRCVERVGLMLTRALLPMAARPQITTSVIPLRRASGPQTPGIPLYGPP